MGLRPEQKRQLLQERRRLLETMGGLLQERQMIQALIKASLTAPLPSGCTLSSKLLSPLLCLLWSGCQHTTQQAPDNLYAYISMWGS